MSGKKALAICTSVIFLSACGGSNDSENPATTAPVTSTGIFIDSAVEGLQYTTDTLSGITNAAGEYQYIAGETVRFSIGGIELGSAPAGPVVTPLSLVNGAIDQTDPVVTNIVRLLLTLDSDSLPDNGITISAATSAAAAGLTVDFTGQDLASDPGVTTLLSQISNQPALVDAQTAQTHFAATLNQQSSWGSMVWGSGTWQAKAP